MPPRGKKEIIGEKPLQEVLETNIKEPIENKKASPVTGSDGGELAPMKVAFASLRKTQNTANDDIFDEKV